MHRGTAQLIALCLGIALEFWLIDSPLSEAITACGSRIDMETVPWVCHADITQVIIKTVVVVALTIAALLYAKRFP